MASSRTTGSSSPLWRIAPPSRQYCSKWLGECAIIRKMLALRSVSLGLLLFTEVLFNPRLTVVPVRKDCWIPKLPTFWVWMSSLVPVRKALLCGVVKWPQFKLPESIGSRLGIAGPEEVMALAPTALEEALLEIAPALLFAPAVVPELETVALEGPLSTLVETPLAKPPASALRSAASANSGP